MSWLQKFKQSFRKGVEIQVSLHLCSHIFHAPPCLINEDTESQSDFEYVSWYFLSPRINTYISFGWDKLLLADPDGDIQNEKRKQNQNAQERLVENFLEGENIPPEGWTTSLERVPEMKHSVVEDFFKNAKDKRHLTNGYAFSKTKKFETSGKPLRINMLPDSNMFLLEGHTRPAMKQAKGISSGSRAVPSADCLGGWNGLKYLIFYPLARFTWKNFPKVNKQT